MDGEETLAKRSQTLHFLWPRAFAVLHRELLQNLGVQNQVMVFDLFGLVTDNQPWYMKILGVTMLQRP